MSNTKKNGELKRGARRISFSPEVFQCLDWLKSKGINFSQKVDNAFRKSPQFKQYIKENKDEDSG